MEAKSKSYDGTGDVKVFLEKVSLSSALKEYEGEKVAQNLASRLEGHAFDVYMRLSADDKKDVKKIELELLIEFEKGKQNREAAIQELNNRKQHQGESALTFAYKVLELVKLSYPTFNETTRKIIVKDYFVRGLHPEMQLALKALPTFEETDINKLASETTQLQLAGIPSFDSKQSPQCMSVNESGLVDSILDKVIHKIGELSTGGLATIGNAETQQACANFDRSGFINRRGSRRGKFRKRSDGRNAGFQNNNQPQRKCQLCLSPDHLVRECPTRFCQACGGRGHDAWDRLCPNFQ